MDLTNELKMFLDLLGDAAEIGGWVIGAWLTFKAIILLSTTGSIVYLTHLGIVSLKDVINKYIVSKRELADIQKRPLVKDVEIDGMCISCDGTYEHVVQSLKMAKTHIDTAGGTYIHMRGAKWIRAAIEEKMLREIENAEGS